MLKYNLALIAGSLVLFGSAVAVASFQFDGAPDRNTDSQSTRKNGDMVIFYHGRSYRALSSRRGSVSNRSFRGGGLRGGK